MLTFAHVQKASLVDKKANIINALKTLCTTDEASRTLLARPHITPPHRDARAPVARRTVCWFRIAMSGASPR